MEKLKPNSRDDATIKQNCEILLLKKVHLRNPLLKSQRVWAYWQEFCGITDTINFEQFRYLPDMESIVRGLRAVQQERKDLAPETADELERREKQEKHRKFFKSAAEKPNLNDKEIFSKTCLI